MVVALAAEAVPSDKPELGPGEAQVSVQSGNAQEVFEKELRAKGIHVFSLGPWKPNLSIPFGMRNRPVPWKQLVEGVAKDGGLKVEWLKTGKGAVLYRGAPDDEVTVFEKRAQAGRLRCWEVSQAWLYRDIRMVPILVRQAKDWTLQHSVRASFKAMGFESVLALDVGAWDVLLDVGVTGAGGMKFCNQCSPGSSYQAEAYLDERGYMSMNLVECHSLAQAVSSLGELGRDRALPLLEKALADPPSAHKGQAVFVFGSAGGDKIVALLKKALDDKDIEVRKASLRALQYAGGPDARELLEKALEDQDPEARCIAARALACLGVEKAVSVAGANADSKVPAAKNDALCALGLSRDGEGIRVLEGIAERGIRARKSNQFGPEGDMRSLAEALGYAGSDKAVACLRMILESEYRQAALRALRHVNPTKSLPILERELALPRDDTLDVIRSVGAIGGATAVTVVERLLEHKDDKVRALAWSTLVGLDPDRAATIAESVLSRADSCARSNALRTLYRTHTERARGVMERMLACPWPNIRNSALYLLVCFGNERSYALAEAGLAAASQDTRASTMMALGFVGGQRALGLLRKMLDHPDVEARCTAIQCVFLAAPDEAEAIYREKLKTERAESVRKRMNDSLRRIAERKQGVKTAPSPAVEPNPDF